MQSIRRPVPLFVLLTALGFLGNLWNVEMFFGVNQVFGSLFVLLAAWALGPWWGALSAALAHSYLIHLWGHPYAYFSFVLEALAVGFLVRKQVNLLYADAFYWIFGALMVPLFYGGIMGMGSDQVLLIALKQPANGLFNALAASLITHMPAFWRPFFTEQTKHRFQELLTTIVMSFLFFSLYVSANINSSKNFDQLLGNITKELATSNGHLVTEFEAFYQRQRDQAREQLSEHLRQREVLVSSAIDHQKTLYWIPRGGEPRAISHQKGFIPPSYKQTTGYRGKLHPTDTPQLIRLHFRGDDGELVALLSRKALIDLLQRHQQLFQRKTQLFLVHQDRVWVSDQPQLVGMPVKQLLQGQRQDTNLDTYHLLPANENLPKMARWSQSTFVHQLSRPGEAWQVLAIQPFGPYVDELQATYREVFALMLALFGVSLLVVHQISRQFVIGFELVHEASTDLPTKLQDGKLPQWPTSNLKELDQLAMNFEEVSQALAQLFTESQERYQKLFSSSHDALLALDPKTLEIQDVNARLVELTGLSAKQLVGRRVAQVLPGLHHETLSKFENAEDQVHYLAGTRHVAVQVRSVLVKSGQQDLLVLILRDMSDRLEAQEQYQLMAMVFETTTEGILITDAETRILMVNRGFEAITGYDASEVIGKTPQMFQSGWQDQAFYQKLWAELKQEGRWEGELWNRNKSGQLYSEWISIYEVKDSQENVRNYVAVVLDITEKKRSEERITQLAFYDELTGLPNRTLFWDRLNHAIDRARRDKQPLALMFLDLDNFKLVNDSLGHEAGDQLLKGVASRVQGELRKVDTLARLGGDEFTLVLEEVTDYAAVTDVASRIIHELHHPFMIEGQEVYSSFSIGICLFPDDAENAGQLLQAADTAMYRAKDLGKNNFQFYTTEMNAANLERMTLENMLRKAISLGEMEVYYQPQIDLKTERIMGAEALLRWKHPERGFIGPATFIPIAESSGLIGEIEAWMLGQVAQQLEVWRQLAPDFKASVNISNYQFAQVDFVERTLEAINCQGSQCEAFELELTERIVMDDAKVRVKLESLKQHGFYLALDDFGTGYSSLGYLKHYRIDKLKIDKSFVDDLLLDEQSLGIVRAIINLSKSLKMRSIAEGVESAEQAKALLELGCEQGQGYLWAKPMPAAEMEALLRDRSPLSTDT